MNRKDLQSACSVIMAAAIITSLGTVGAMNSNLNENTLNNNTMISAPTSITIEDMQAAIKLNS